MLSMDKASAWIYRCCGISPAGNRNDKYFTFTAVILVISLTLRRSVSIFGAYKGYAALFITLRMPLLSVGAGGLIIRNWVNPDSYINMITELEENEAHSTVGKDSRKYIWIIVSIICLTQVPILYHFDFYYCMTVLLTVTILNGPVLQIITLVEKIRIRFLAVNNQLVRLAQDSDTSSISNKLESAFRLHSTLHAETVDVDLHFCFYNLLSYVYKFLFCVCGMYGCLISIETPNLKLPYSVFMGFVIQVVFFIVQAIVCHRCSKEANRTVLLAHRVLKPDSPIRLWEEVGLFSVLAMDNKVHFTVGGIFTLDRALIIQTFLAALSYLIIAVQLREVKLFGDNISEPSVSTVSQGLDFTVEIFHNED